MARALAVFNPKAGRGRAERLKPAIIDTLHRFEVDFDAVDTPERGAGASVARRGAEQGYGLIIAVGGDGHVHEIINGLLQADIGPDEIALGIVPVGSGNDFVKMLDLPAEDVAVACRRIAQGETRVVDVGRINLMAGPRHTIFDVAAGRPRYFANVLGMGFTALTAVESQKIDWLTGLPLYLVALIRTLALTYRTPEMRIDLDGRTIHQRTTEVAVANGRCEGGGFWIAPDAEIDDGLFDVAHLRGLSRVGILRIVPDVLQGTHTDKEPVTMAQTRYVSMKSELPLPVQADGEILASSITRLEAEIVPRCLRIVA